MAAWRFFRGGKLQANHFALSLSLLPAASRTGSPWMCHNDCAASA